MNAQQTQKNRSRLKTLAVNLGTHTSNSRTYTLKAYYHSIQLKEYSKPAFWSYQIEVTSHAGLQAHDLHIKENDGNQLVASISPKGSVFADTSDPELETALAALVATYQIPLLKANLRDWRRDRLVSNLVSPTEVATYTAARMMILADKDEQVAKLANQLFTCCDLDAPCNCIQIAKQALTLARTLV